MASEKVRTGLNEQINHELYAAYLYLAMAVYFERRSLSGFGNWMRMQAREEVGHAMRILEFLLDRGAPVRLEAIDRPEAEFETPLEVMRAALEHERRVTRLIDDLYELAQEERDHPAQVLLQWFVTEQVEEEASAGDLVDRLEMAGDSGSALLMLDQQMGERGEAS